VSGAGRAWNMHPLISDTIWTLTIALLGYVVGYLATVAIMFCM